MIRLTIGGIEKFEELLPFFMEEDIKHAEKIEGYKYTVTVVDNITPEYLHSIIKDLRAAEHKVVLEHMWSGHYVSHARN